MYAGEGLCGPGVSWITGICLDLGYAPHGVFLCVFSPKGFGVFGKQFYNMGFLCPPLGFVYFTKEVCSKMDLYLAIILIAAALVLGLGAGVGIGMLLRKRFAEREIGSAEAEATRLINEAIRGGENKKKEMLLEAKDEIHRSRTEHEKEVKEHWKCGCRKDLSN